MIISRLIGGLGNQMFQYAAGRALTLARGQSYKLDVTDFSGYSLHHGFELDRVFNVCSQHASEVEIRSILGWQGWGSVRRLLARRQLAPLRRRAFVVEPSFAYWSGISSVPTDCYLVGYWQSEKYFKSIADTLRQDFSFKVPLWGRNAELAGEINRSNAVSLHVRRGDYMSNPKTLATHGLCTLEYYRSAMVHIAERVHNPCFYIFSDDMSWVQNNLGAGFLCHYVAHNNGKDSYNDMQLMSLCRHHIVANSSFSWWGAWLNPSVEKIVIMPAHWFARATLATDDISPAQWLRIGNNGEET